MWNWLNTELCLNIILSVQIKPHIISFQIYKVTKTKEFHVKEPLYLFLYKVKESLNSESL